MPRKKQPVLSELQRRALETSIRRAAGQINRTQTRLVTKKYHSGRSTYVVPR